MTKNITFETIQPNFAIVHPKGYFERMDSWGNPRFTQDKRKAFRGLFGDCQNEIVIRGLREIEIRAI